MDRIICAICLDADLGARIAQSVSALPCGHVFHSNCVQGLFLHSGVSAVARCPTCRQAANKKQVLKIFFNLAEYSIPESDAEVGAAVIENLKRQIEQLKERIQTSQKTCADKENLTALLREKIHKLEEKLMSSELQCSALSLTRVKLNKKTKECEVALDENMKLKKQLESCRAIVTLTNTSVGPQEELEALQAMEKQDLMKLFLNCKRDCHKLLKKYSAQTVSLNKAETTVRKLESRIVELEDMISVLQRVNEIYKGGNWNERNGNSEGAVAVSSPVPSPAPSVGNVSTAGISSGSSISSTSSARVRVNCGRTLLPSARSMPRSNAETFDGLGGHSRLDNFPRGKIVTSRVAPKKRKLNC